MTGVEFATQVRFYTQTNSTTLTNSTIATLAQTVKDYILAPKISGTKEGTFEVPATRDLPVYSSSTPPREIALPDDILDALVRVEVKFDSDGDYVPLAEISQVQNTDSEQESFITNNFNCIRKDTSNPQGACYDKRRNSIFIYSGDWGAAVTAGIKIWYNAFPASIEATDLASTSDLSIPDTETEVTIPRMFHELWARGVSKMWKETRDKPIPLSMLEQVFDADLDTKISEFRNSNDDLSINAPLPNDQRMQY